MNIDFEQLQQMAEKAKRHYEEVQQRMAAVVVEASSGGGMVQVKMNGQKQVLELRLDPEVARDDVEMLSDLVRAAMNEAGQRVDARLQSEMGGLAGLGNLANLFK
ncbi:MAG: YbaB/EbfC family nucleoid-associated protein [Terriglobales bacterium]